MKPKPYMPLNMAHATQPSTLAYPQPVCLPVIPRATHTVPSTQNALPLHYSATLEFNPNATSSRKPSLTTSPPS